MGSGHSAVGSLIDLVRLKDEAPDTQVIWLVRGSPEKAFGGGANDKLAARGELGVVFSQLVRDARLKVEKEFRVSQIDAQGDKLRVMTGATGRNVLVDQLIVATGFRPDLSFLRELRIALDLPIEAPPALAPLIDPMSIGCGTVRPHRRENWPSQPRFLFCRHEILWPCPTFLMVTGYEQVRSIVAEIAGDHEAAQRCELVLPETGVCSRPVEGIAETNCCGGPPK